MIDSRIVPFTLETKAAGEADDTFSGLGGAYLSLDRTGDIIDVGAFADTIAFTKSKGKIRDEHAVTTGNIIDARDTPQGLWIRGRILPTTAGKDQLILVSGKAIQDLSIGYVAQEREWLEGPEAVAAYWESKGYRPTPHDVAMLSNCGGCARLITRARVYEVSTTWLPANENCTITGKSDAPRGGRTLADDSERTLAVLEEFTGRVERLKARRAETGRDLGRKSLQTLARVKARIEDLMSATSPTDEDLADVGRALMDRYIKLGERLRDAN